MLFDETRDVMTVEVRDLGTVDYGDCLELQYEILQDVQNGADGVILVVEHPLVATLGRRGEASDIFDKSLPVFSIERGGKATLHGPGQLVVYPIIHLGEDNRDVRAWVRHLEQFLINMLENFGINGQSDPNYPGIWVVENHKKIASIGIAVKGWVSFHGIAINVNLPPNEFERIDPCGLGSAIMTNMELEGSAASIAEVRNWVVENAANHFSDLRLTNNNTEIT